MVNLYKFTFVSTNNHASPFGSSLERSLYHAISCRSKGDTWLNGLHNVWEGTSWGCMIRFVLQIGVSIVDSSEDAV